MTTEPAQTQLRLQTWRMQLKADMPWRRECDWADVSWRREGAWREEQLLRAQLLVLMPVVENLWRQLWMQGRAGGQAGGRSSCEQHTAFALRTAPRTSDTRSSLGMRRGNVVWRQK